MLMLNDVIRNICVTFYFVFAFYFTKFHSTQTVNERK